MTTIRAHVPVETPAGLVVALPPARFGTRECVIPGTVFTLAVPCYVRQQDEWLHDGQPFPCPRCQGTDWLINGRYRILSITDEWPTKTPAVPGGVALIVEPA
jgi:hypothetical protein